MGALDLYIGNVNEKNNGLLLGGPNHDIKNAANNIADATKQILSPLNVVTENLIDTVRHPINNIFNPKVKTGSYEKLAKFVPSTIALAITQALDKPFATIEKTIEYVINNNLERGLTTVKGVSTKFLANIITNNGESSSKTANFLGSAIEGTGDLVGSIVKTPFWLVHKGLKAVRNTNGYGTKVMADWSTDFVNEQRINSKDYLNLNLINSNRKTNSDEKVAA